MAARSIAPVNLLPTDRFEFSKVGRFLQWALSTGRYVVVFTELIVIAAFLSRFYFDRKLDDLRKQRLQKVAVIDSFAEVQKQFQLTQAALAATKSVIDRQYHPAEILDRLQTLTPVGIEYESVNVSSQSATIQGFSPGSTPFSSLLTLLVQDSAYSAVAVTRLEQSPDRSPGLDFTIDVTINVSNKKSGEKS